MTLSLTRPATSVPPFTLDAIVGSSASTTKLRNLVGKLAASPCSTVLITGESGTGKDVAAHAIHDGSARRAGPFLNLTCSALPEALHESELFGHERGAFTDAHAPRTGLCEAADGGTLFLDEVAEMSPTLQAKLLRFLEERKFRRVGGRVDLHPDVRVIAATHRDLDVAVRDGRFRLDLFYRLSVLQLHIAPLRERRDDVLSLAFHFLDRLQRDHGRPVRGLTSAAQRLLEAHGWPGNTRELRNALERAVHMAGASGPLDVSDFPEVAAASTPAAQLLLPPCGVSLPDLERRLLLQALEVAGGSQARAGALLGLTRDQVRRLVLKLATRPEGPGSNHA